MIKKISIIAIMGFVLIACGTSSKTTAATTTTKTKVGTKTTKGVNLSAKKDVTNKKDVKMISAQDTRTAVKKEKKQTIQKTK